MDLDLSTDQIALRDGIAALLEGRFGMDRVRGGFDREMFAELTEAGVFSLRADGFSWADCTIVFEQLGRFCVPGPLVPSLLFESGRIVGFADEAEPETGEPVWIEHLAVLEDLVVGSGDAIRHVDPAALTGELSSWPLDPLTPIARVRTLPAGTAIDADGAELRRRGAVLTAALQLGLADRCTDMAVDYAKERVQFDRPIAAFQAIKHLCADMLVRTEVARAAVYAAGAHLDDPEEPGLDRGISGAKALAGEAAIVNGKTAMQVFGGMGFTWEVDVHLYLKRAWVLDTHFGSGDAHADVVGAALAASSAAPVGGT
jgi:alkylation response protein AidB-like acyl-CoA dehydrogenase